MTYTPPAPGMLRNDSTGNDGKTDDKTDNQGGLRP